MTLKTPVALMVFNRLEPVKKLLAALKPAKPSKIYLIADGARADVPNEAEKCKEVIEYIKNEITNNRDWDCDLQTDIASKNMGLKQRITSGLNRCFEETEELIILEDDCIPDVSFFRFCEEMLEKYRFDTRIMTVSGNNFQFGQTPCPYSYYFSRYMHCWGWATWKRAWKLYDDDMQYWEALKQDGWLDYICTDVTEKRYWSFIFDATASGKISSWVYPFVFSIWKQNALNILPAKNLVTNIGFGDNATHTVNTNSPFNNVPAESLEFPLTHPPHMVRNYIADEFYARVATKPQRQFMW